MNHHLPVIATILVFAFHKSVVNDVFMKRHGACATPFIVHLGITLLSKTSLWFALRPYFVLYTQISFITLQAEKWLWLPHPRAPIKASGASGHANYY